MCSLVTVGVSEDAVKTDEQGVTAEEAETVAAEVCDKAGGATVRSFFVGGSSEHAKAVSTEGGGLECEAALRF
jgi:hypothetical protein